MTTPKLSERLRAEADALCQCKHDHFEGEACAAAEAKREAADEVVGLERQLRVVGDNLLAALEARDEARAKLAAAEQNERQAEARAKHFADEYAAAVRRADAAEQERDLLRAIVATLPLCAACRMGTPSTDTIATYRVLGDDALLCAGHARKAEEDDGEATRSLDWCDEAEALEAWRAKERVGRGDTPEAAVRDLAGRVGVNVPEALLAPKCVACERQLDVAFGRCMLRTGPTEHTCGRPR